MARIAKSLDTLRSQVNAAYPNRSKSSDGWLGDAAHAARKSDHNPNAAGVVQALDITHDPARGLDAGLFAEVLLRNKDPRIKYIISNRRISTPQWTWKPYTGANAHTAHVHISVNNSPTLYDDAKPWNLSMTLPTPRPQPMPRPTTKNTYNESLERLLVHEGGYSDDPDDPGGPTNFGITLTDYRRHIHLSGTATNLRQMSVDQAKKIYKEKYWDAMNCDALPDGVDYAVFDYGVNSGIGRAPKVLQRVVGLRDDGMIGAHTINAVLARDPRLIINAICDERMAYLRTLAHWTKFSKGWTRRVTEVRAAALAMTGAPPPPITNMEKTIGIGGANMAALAAVGSWFADNPAVAVPLFAVAVLGITAVVYFIIHKAQK